MHVLNRLLITLYCITFGATTWAVTWPGPQPCAATLQECINASPVGSTIEIASNAPIDENLVINRAGQLRAAPGYHPQLAVGRGITGTSSGSAAYVVAIDGLKITNAIIRFTHAGSGTANVFIQGNTITSTNATIQSGIRLDNAIGAGTASFSVYNNHLRVASTSSLDAAIGVKYVQNSGMAVISFNQVEAIGEGQGWGILVDASSGATPQALVVNNRVRGRFTRRRAIDISEGFFPGAASTVTARVVGNVVIGRNHMGNGIGHMVNNGTINTQFLNNTVVGAGYSALFARWSTEAGPGTGTISGPVENNLLAHGEYGLFISPEQRTGVTEDYNLLYGNADNGYDPGPNDITSDPRLLSLSNPRLAAGSPAINSGDFTRTLMVLNALSVPALYDSASTIVSSSTIGLLDADGLRRIKGGGIDIGAYEWGDASFTAVARSVPPPRPHTFSLNDGRINGDPNAHLFITARYSALEGGQTNPRVAGVYFDTLDNAWSIFNQDTSATMPLGTRYNVFAPAQGANNVFVETSSGTPSARFYLTSWGLFDRSVVLITSNWNPRGALSGVYNNHTTSVGYVWSSHDWFIKNNDNAPMLTGASFNVYTQDPSPNVFVHYVGAHNLAYGNFATRLDHPLLNGIACANVHVTPRAELRGDPNAELLHGDQTFDTYYDGSYWHIYNNSQLPSSQMNLRSSFSVVIDAAQVEGCTLPLMSDGFED